MADSVFSNVESAPPIEVFQMSKLYNESTDPNKVNLGVGAYRTDEGKPWVLPVVSTAELQMANDRTLNHEYLPVAGLPDFRSAALGLLFGSDHKVITENRVEGFQALGGTGALRLAAEFSKKVLQFDTVYVSSPTWGNHKGVFKAAGFSNIKEYRYWDAESRGLNLPGMLEDLMAAPPKSMVILHAVAHNPTGVDATKEQWGEIARVCKEKQLFVLLDCAYQGFASGNLDEDAWACRFFANQDVDLFVAQSFSKNFGLYNERIGNLAVVTKDPKKLPEIRSQMEIMIRIMWSNPPNHGARIVATVLNNKAYYDDWKGQIMTMASRIQKMREELADNLKKLGTPGNWDHIVKQIGMFSFTGLTPKQVEYMISKHVYMLGSGRISIAGLTPKNVQYVAKCMDEAVRAYPNLKLKPAEHKSDSQPLSFVEFARRKLEKTEPRMLRTNVVIDGIIHSDSLEEMPEKKEKKVDSVTSFVKVQMEGSLSSVSISTTGIETAQNAPKLSAEEKLIDMVIGDDKEDPRLQEFEDVHSSVTQPGTMRSSVKTFKSRSQQTLPQAKIEEELNIKGIPARFEGTMVTPVFFEGRMLTPESLDQMLAEAAKKKGALTIPVSFEGGMLTAAFRSIKERTAASEEEGAGDVAVPVKFSGRLQGISEEGEDQGLPVTFDGTMATKGKKQGKQGQ
ncbi:aspartate aminotransferase [Elysia marginata]|uniref:Aspartate aminotransferase n=1 Tax=Elysia marginata TaxID=1093978 RepID=A0AAV4EGP3_9GAST|nr:aspartate aminotransferase [Elysia marginata]